MSQDLIKELHQKAELYAQTPDGAWLNEFDWKNALEVRVVEKFSFEWLSGFYGFGYLFIHQADVSTIFYMYIHELRHRWQWKKNPLKYLIGKVIRPIIERDADREQKKADDWFCMMADKKWEDA